MLARIEASILGSQACAAVDVSRLIGATLPHTWREARESPHHMRPRMSRTHPHAAQCSGWRVEGAGLCRIAAATTSVLLPMRLPPTITDHRHTTTTDATTPVPAPSASQLSGAAIAMYACGGVFGAVLVGILASACLEHVRAWRRRRVLFDYGFACRLRGGQRSEAPGFVVHVERRDGWTEQPLARLACPDTQITRLLPA